MMDASALSWLDGTIERHTNAGVHSRGGTVSGRSPGEFRQPSCQRFLYGQAPPWCIMARDSEKANGSSYFRGNSCSESVRGRSAWETWSAGGDSAARRGRWRPDGSRGRGRDGRRVDGAPAVGPVTPVRSRPVAGPPPATLRLPRARAGYDRPPTDRRGGAGAGGDQRAAGLESGMSSREWNGCPVCSSFDTHRWLMLF